MDSYARYYANCGKGIASLAPFYVNVDRSAAHRHPPAIMDRELSSAYKPIIGISPTGEAPATTTTSAAPPPATIAAAPPTGYPPPGAYPPPAATAYPPPYVPTPQLAV